MRIDNNTENSQQLPEEDSGEVSAVQRQFVGWQSNMMYVVAVAMSLFHLWINTIGIMPEIQRNAVHFAFILFLGFLLFPFSQRVSKQTLWVDYILAILSVAAGVYLVLFEDALHDRNEVPIIMDLIAAGIAVALMLEITRRTTGWLIPTLSLLFYFIRSFFWVMCLAVYGIFRVSV